MYIYSHNSSRNENAYPELGRTVRTVERNADREFPSPETHSVTGAHF